MKTGISMRELQKMSAERIESLPHPTPVVSGSRTVGLLVPRPEERAVKLRRLAAQSAAINASFTDEERARIERMLGERDD